MNNFIRSFGNSKVRTALYDLREYFQVPINDENKDKTAFISHYGTYAYMCLPFDLRNAPVPFQRALNIILSRASRETCLANIDAFAVFSS